MLGDDQAVTGPDAYRAAYRTFAEAKIRDPESLSRDMLRARLVEELSELGAAYPAPRAPGGSPIWR
ncbi:uncharacterized protein SOCE836_012340 [Sorangium cellulosum]|uniref:Uncharacterized protein n=1 Tax=Sorangium cellulosum TaxID=56 RepID=A0A4P2QHR8_SORCE|nr:uncharacterized protein SOCE836_012340 [Sorangium cellulosum]